MARTKVTGTPILVSPFHSLQWAVSVDGDRCGYNAHSGSLSMLNAEQQLVAAFVNPVGSKIDVYLDRIAVTSNMAGEWRRYRGGIITPSTPDNPAPSVNRGGGTATAKAKLYPATQIAATSGGTHTKSLYTGANAGFENNTAGTLILRPGQALHWTYGPTPQGHSNVRAALELVWWEEDAAA